MKELKNKPFILVLGICFTLLLMILGFNQTLSRQEFQNQILQNIKSDNSIQLEQLIRSNRSEAIRFIESLIDSSVMKRVEGKSNDGNKNFDIAKTLAGIYKKVFRDDYYVKRVIRNQTFSSESLQKKAEIIKLKEQGKNDFYQGDFYSALDKYINALQLAEEIDDADERATLPGNIGAAFFYLGEFDTALVYYQESLSHLEEIGDMRRVGNRLGNIANVYSDKSDYPNALAYFKKVFKVREELNDQQGMAADLNNIGLVYQEMGAYKLALNHYQKAYKINKSMNNIRSMGKNLANIANVRIKFGDYDKALTIYQESIELRRQTGDRKGEGIDLGNMGIIYQTLGDFTGAASYFQKALTIEREIGYREGEAYQLGRLAELYSIRGEYAKAIQSYNEALDIHRDLGHVYGEATWLEALGGIYLEVGDYQRALGSLQQVFELHKGIGNRSGEASTYTKIGHVYQGMKDYEKARNSYELSRKIHRELGEKAGECLNNIYLSYLLNMNGDTELALENLKNAEKISDGIGERMLQILVQEQLGDFYRGQGDVKNAHRAYGKGISISEGLENPELKWQLFYGDGKLWELQGDDERAYYAYQATVTSIEDIREKAEIEELRAGIFRDRFEAYRAIINVLVRMGRIDEAFQYIERSRSRNLLDLLGNAKIPIKGIQTQEQIKREQILRAKIKALVTQISEETRRNKESVRDAAIEDYQTELQETRQEYKNLLIDLKLQNLEYASLVSIETISASTTQKMLDEESALLEYLVSKNSIIIFVVTKEAVHVVTVAEGEASIRGRIMLFQGTAVEDISAEKLLEQHWILPMQDLYDILIKPVINNGYLANKKHLIIIPHGLLHYLPFQALIVGHESQITKSSRPHFLIEDFDITYAPSASVLRLCKKKGSFPGNSLLLLAPRISALPMSENEVKEIAATYGEGAECYLRGRATESLVKEQGQKFRQLHFATTAVFNKSNPLFSRLELAGDDRDDGNLEVHEIFGLNLNASMITISACQTALGSGYTVAVPQGDDLISLCRAFLYAGSPSVVASLWEITDPSTALFMIRFYTHLKNMTKSEALAQTQRDMISGDVFLKEGEKTDVYSHPYHWASFVLVGDWE
jgi:pentatricopeptide repeat protein